MLVESKAVVALKRTYSMSLTRALLNCSLCFLGLEKAEPAVCDRCLLPGGGGGRPAPPPLLLELGNS